jgi:hypothetical protein
MSTFLNLDLDHHLLQRQAHRLSTVLHSVLYSIGGSVRAASRS